MTEEEQNDILDFATRKITLEQFLKKYPSYSDNEYLLGQYEFAFVSKNKDLLSYIRLIPINEVSKFKDIFKKLILEDWHIENEDMIGYFQLIFNYEVDNINFLIQAISSVPDYLKFDAMKYPYIRKIIYAIGAQPEPYNIEALEKLANETDDEQIKDLVIHQIKKRKELGRWEASKNSQ